MKPIFLSLLTVSLFSQSPDFNNRVELKGPGIQVSLSLNGFNKEAGEGKLSDQHTRLGMFASNPSTTKELGGSLIVSVISHDLPKGADLQKMGSVIAAEKVRSVLLDPSVDDGSFLQMKRFKTPDGLYLFLSRITTTKKIRTGFFNSTLNTSRMGFG